MDKLLSHMHNYNLYACKKSVCTNHLKKFQSREGVQSVWPLGKCTLSRLDFIVELGRTRQGQLDCLLPVFAYGAYQALSQD